MSLINSESRNRPFGFLKNLTVDGFLFLLHKDSVVICIYPQVRFRRAATGLILVQPAKGHPAGVKKVASWNK